jgi:lipopolysaccharide/colanic/teichoic acid biosynthesis glycosyltransferase
MIETRVRPAAIASASQSSTTSQGSTYAVSKRVLDFSIGLIGLLVALPILLVAMAAIVATTRKAPLLAQRRLGLHERPFTMFKLRTMRDGPALPKSARNPRVTRVGVVLRRSSIDELPQLVNVVLGQMSLVGPRPVLASEAASYSESWRRRFDVTPGLTGLWQVSGRSELSLRQWMELDRLYVQRRSMRLDLMILLWTVRAVLTMRGAW